MVFPAPQYLLDTMPTGREEVGGPQWRRMIVLGCVGIAIAYSDRSNISTAIVAMKEEFGWCAGHCRACFGCLPVLLRPCVRRSLTAEG